MLEQRLILQEAALHLSFDLGGGSAHALAAGQLSLAGADAGILTDLTRKRPALRWQGLIWTDQAGK